MAPRTKDKNPRNPESGLFRKLTRLLSGPIVNYRRQMPRQLKRRQLDAYKFKSASGQAFKRGEYNPYDSMNANFMANQNRAERYVDFDQMEFTPEIASALDIYADEMTTSSALQPLLNIKCSNEEIKAVLDNLYHSVLNIEFNLFGWARTMCKFGDMFLYLDIDETTGIKHAIGLPQQEVERVEGEDKTNPNYVQFQWNSGGITFENWQVAHFRILGQDKYSPYGTSILESARRIWRQLTLMEDAIMAYRIVRSPERRVFYIDVGNINPQDVEQYMQKVMTQMKRNQIVNDDTGRVDLRYNPMSVEEDYYIPVRGDTSSKIETLSGGSYTGDIDDVKYLRDKLFSALKIPASYLSSGEGMEEDKTTLAQKDIRFARTIQRLQRSIVAELEKVGVIHLFTLGYRGNDLVSFKLFLNNPSKLAEMQELEHWRTKFDVASAATEGFFSKRWVSEHLFSLTEEEFLRSQRELFYDRKFEANLEKAVEEISAEEGEGLEGGGGLGELGALGGPDEELGGEELGGEELGGEEMDLEGEMEPPSDDVLLAAPAKRDDVKSSIKVKSKKTGKTTTSKSKGHWYMPKKDDTRDMGARQRSYLGQAGQEAASATPRNIWKGGSEMKSLSKGIYESKEDNYHEKEEQEVLKLNFEVKKLIKDMESKK
tara:strand:+ start:3858 stop:5825 length:1968 start_codon:yes stop_codon:yes gene_type:complete